MRLGQNIETGKIGGTNFTFSKIGIHALGATEYTLVTIAVDVSGSVSGFKDELEKMLSTVIESCKKSPRSNNLLVRVITFSSSLRPNGIQELHGFIPLSSVDPGVYKLDPSGGTPLFDASISAIGASNAYAKELSENDYLCNAIVVIITDGDDNGSTYTMKMVKEEIERGEQQEIVESTIAILVGINAAQYRKELEEFARVVDMKFIDAGNATPGKVAKLAEFVSQSVSSQSQALGTGGPSKDIAVII